MDARWEHFAHQADVGVRGLGPTMAAAFEQAALALTAVIVDPATVEPRDEIAVHCAAADDELLLVDWLNALIYEMAVRRMLFSRFVVRIGEHGLDGRAAGEPFDARRHEARVEPKGATYTALRVAREPDGAWVAQCVVDV